MKFVIIHYLILNKFWTKVCLLWKQLLWVFFLEIFFITTFITCTQILSWNIKINTIIHKTFPKWPLSISNKTNKKIHYCGLRSIKKKYTQNDTFNTQVNKVYICFQWCKFHWYILLASCKFITLSYLCQWPQPCE